MLFRSIGLIGQSAVSWARPPHLRPVRDFKIAAAFTSIAEARDSLDYMTYMRYLDPGRICARTQEPGSFDDTLSEEAIQIAGRWLSAFQQLSTELECRGQMTSREKQALDVLKMRSYGLKYTVKVYFQHSDLSESDPSNSGVIPSDLIEIVEAERVTLAESVVLEIGNESTSHHFTLDLGIIGPMYDIARSCRDPSTRRRAIAVLYNYPRREGLWDSLLAARVAERTMMHEENAASAAVTKSSDVPEWARITTVLPKFSISERKATVTYIKDQLPADHHDRVFEETLCW